MNRRNFLKQTSSLLVTSPLAYKMLSSILVNSLIKSSIAEAQGTQTSLNYLNILMAGAPSRFMFDQWLRTSDTEPALNYNGMTGNSFQVSGGLITGVTTNYFNYKGFKLPHLFSQSVKISSGNKNLSELLNSMLVIRGYGTGIDGHAGNHTLQAAPLGGAPSLSGLVADNSNKIFEAIQVPNRGSYHTFNSLKGKAINILPINDPLSALFEGFSKPNNMKSHVIKTIHQSAFEEAKLKLRKYSSENSKSSAILHGNLLNAEKLIKKGIDNLSSYWLEALPRYKRIINDAIKTQNIEGINNFTIVSDESNQWKFQSGANGLIISKNVPMNSALDSSSIDLLAEGLAVTEYVLTEDLGQSLEIRCSDLYNLNLLIKDATQSQLFSHLNDMHETGARASVFLLNAYYRGLSAGLLELIDKLKGGKIWEKTLIQISSEFGRSPRADLSGSDHGFNSMVTSCFSGSYTEGPYLIGNVINSDQVSYYPGAQGLGAEISGYNQKGRPTPLMAASTIAQLLNVEKNPFSNLAAPLIKNNNGILVYESYGKGKLVNS